LKREDAKSAKIVRKESNQRISPPVYNRDPMPEHDHIGIIIVDHGSRREASNQLLEEVARQFAAFSGAGIVEPAHMDLASPTISEAFDRCVARGARMVVIHPYFLLPGRHWSEDIPRLAAEAASHHPGVDYLVTAPLGLHPLMSKIINDRIEHCLSCARGEIGPCEMCGDGSGCRFRSQVAEEGRAQD
jgi:sirohydrochlorin ferrochelatase